MVVLLVVTIPAVARTAVATEVPLGEGRAKLSGSLAAWHVFRLDPDTPSERPSSTLDTKLEGDPAPHFHFFLETRLGYDGKIGDPDRGNPVLDLDEIYQDKDLFMSFEEAYVDLLFRRFELRLGKQKVSWGRLDELQPTDNLNPEDLTEFLFRPELERKIGVPGAALTAYLGAWTAEAVWNPIYTANRFPNRKDRWFPPLLTVPERVVTPLGAVPVRTRYPDVDEPPHTLASSDAALRIGRRIGSAEVSASIFHGWDKTPTFSVRGTATVVPTNNPAAPAAPNIDLTVFPTLHRITVVGGDLAVPIWVLALRAEAAWIHGRFFPVLLRDLDRDPRLVAAIAEAGTRVAQSGVPEPVPLPLAAAERQRETIEYGIGFDYTMNEAVSRRLTGGEVLSGSFVLVQLMETVIFDGAAPLISQSVEHLLGLTLRQTFRDDRLLAELKIAYNPNHGDFYLWPQLGYKLTSNLHALVEARVLGGDGIHPIGQYRDYDGIRIGLKRFF
jgi:hypothetical protein